MILTQIKEQLGECLQNDHNKDYLLCMRFIDSRDWESLLEILHSIIKFIEKQPKRDRSKNYYLLINVYSEIRIYVNKMYE